MSHRTVRTLSLLSLLAATACTGLLPQGGVVPERELTVRGANLAQGAVLTGIVRAPAGIVSNASGGLIGDHGAGIISNNGAGFVSKTKYRALALDEQPLAGTLVHLADAGGRPIGRIAPVRTDAAGRFTFKNLPKGVTFVVIAAAKTASEQSVQLKALAMAGQADGAVNVGVATTFVTTAAVDGQAGALGNLDAPTYHKAVGAVSEAIGPDDAAALTSDQAVLAAVDRLAQQVPAIKQALSALRQEVEDIKVRLDELEAKIDQVAQASPAPDASSAPAASVAPVASPGAVTEPAPSVPPNASPSPLGPMVSTLAGSGTAAFANGTGAAASFNELRGITADGAGNVYVAERSNNRIRKITPAGVVTTVAGDGTSGFTNGPAATARFNNPTDVAVDASGVLYVVDTNNHAVRKIANGTVSTLAGGVRGYAEGTGTEARFSAPWGLTVGNGKVYVADTYNHRIRAIDVASGAVTTYAGDGTPGYKDSNKLASQFHVPQDVVLIASSGTLYVADRDNHCIRKITSGGTVTTLAGSGTAGYAEGTGAEARFNQPHGLATDSSGSLYVADYMNHRIRRITSAGVVSTVAGDGTAGFKDGPAAASQLNGPLGVAVDGQKNLYVGDRHNHRVRKLTP